MNLFEQEESRTYFEKLKNELKITIKNLSDTQILTTDFNELTEYYKSKFYIDPLHLYMDKVSTNMEKSKVQKYNHFYRIGYYEPKFFEVDSCKINYNIPFSGSYNLLHLIPSQRILSRFTIDGFDNLHNSDFLPSIKFSLNIDMHTLEQESNPQEYIDSTFKREFNSYQSMVDYVNNDVNSYNNSSNTSSPTGEINTETLAPEACAVCGGSGMVTCGYCRGTGKGQTISVIGMPTEQGCTYCGSTGKRLCPGCNGSGQK